jgi:RNA polymerase sigma factor (sigma-70 family)
VHSTKKYCSKECFIDDRTIPIKPIPPGSLEQTEVENLILQYESLVQKVVRRLYSQLMPITMEYDDFLQEGYLALIHAYLKSGRVEDKSFAGYAKRYIYGYVLNAWKEQDRTISLPRNIFAKRSITQEQLEQYTLSSRPLDLESLKAKAASETTKRRGQRGPLSLPVEDELVKSEQIRDLYQALERLIPRDCILICDQFGLNGEPIPPSQVGIKFSLPHNTACYQVHRGLKQLKYHLSK